MFQALNLTDSAKSECKSKTKSVIEPVTNNSYQRWWSLIIFLLRCGYIYILSQKFNFGMCNGLNTSETVHNTRLSIGYQAITDVHKNKELQGSNSPFMNCVMLYHSSQTTTH